ncbi:MAG: hypothetical protein AAB152_12110 [Candidatus Coatesbacteria bacterium]
MIALLLALALAGPGAGISAEAEAPRPASPAGMPAGPAAVRRFADELFARGDWFRAATEYLRAASYDPAAPDAGELTFRAALAAYRAGQWTEARRRLLELGEVSAPELAGRSRYLAAAASYRAGDWDDARILAGRARAGSSAISDRAAYIEGLSDLQLGRWPDARAAFGAVPPASGLAGSAGALAGLADRGARLPHPSPWVTAGLSAVVPGLGQIVSGYVWDGLSALLLTGGSAALLAAGVHRDNSALQAAGAAGLAIFYPANVFGGANAAGRRTRDARHRLLDDAGRLSTLSLE